MNDIKLIRMLEILGGDQVVIPGCEALSALSSEVLLRNRKCCSATIDLDLALNLIPGSTIQFFENASRSSSGGMIKRMFVLPSETIDCSCGPVDDWYKILRDAACDVDDEEVNTLCDESYEMPKCKGDDYNVAPVINPYVEEGSFYGEISDFYNRKFELDLGGYLQL